MCIRDRPTPYREITDNILVEAFPSFVPDQSVPEQDKFLYAYNIKISNLGKTKVKLLKRHWIIRDGKKRERFVNGEGVVGKQPELSPHQGFSYSSFCPLETPTGNMRGKFQMQDENGNTFWVTVPLFFFRPPTTLYH